MTRCTKPMWQAVGLLQDLFYDTERSWYDRRKLLRQITASQHIFSAVSMVNNDLRKSRAGSKLLLNPSSPVHWPLQSKLPAAGQPAGGTGEYGCEHGAAPFDHPHPYAPTPLRTRTWGRRTRMRVRVRRGVLAPARGGGCAHLRPSVPAPRKHAHYTCNAQQTHTGPFRTRTAAQTIQKGRHRR